MKALKSTKYIYLNYLRNWPVSQTHHKEMLLVYKENYFAKPVSFTPNIHGEKFTPIGLNSSFWPYLHIGDLKNVLEDITIYQYDTIFPCPLDSVEGRDKLTKMNIITMGIWNHLGIRRCFSIKQEIGHNQSD